MLHNLGVRRGLRWFLSASLLAIAIIAYATALPTNWFKSAEVTGTILSPPPHTWIVDDDGPAHFRKIQEAINAAKPGDTIYVHNGTYYENVIVNKTVSLIGENRDITIIKSNRTTVYIATGNVYISGFTIRNNGIDEIAVYVKNGENSSIVANNVNNQHGPGIVIENSSRSKVFRNNVLNTYGRGIHLRYSESSTITENVVENNGGYGVWLFLSGNSAIKRNVVNNNYDSNIVIERSNRSLITGNTASKTEFSIVLQDTEDCILQENEISGSYVGLWVNTAFNTTLVGNSITNNSIGVRIYGSGNILYHNNFINNTMFQVQVPYHEANMWDDAYPSGGNFWSDYIGVDVKSGSGQDLPGSDGIGDMTYIIDANNRDRYPLTKPWSPRVTSVITISSEPATVTVGSDVTIDGAITPVRTNVNVAIYHRLVGGGIWYTLATLKTNSTGGYTYVWKPTQIATHELKAIWLGDAITLPAESKITIVNVTPIHDIALIRVVPSATEVYVGWTVNIAVTVGNEGNVTETFTVTCKYELEGVEHTIGTATINNLAPNVNATLTFTWATTDITVHTIKAEIPPLTDETDTIDNTMTSPIKVKVKMLGDVNGDNKIDIEDIVTAALAFGSYPNHPRWNRIADINQDNKIDIDDIILIAMNFGKTNP